MLLLLSPRMQKRRPRIQRDCVQCGATFWADQSAVDKGHARFCSKTCWYSTGRRTLACQHCRKEFQTFIADGGRKYCSPECRTAAKNVTLVCVGCGKDFTVWMAFKKRKYCSDKCYGKAPNKVSKQCAECGAEYLTIPSRSQTSRFCSFSCLISANAKLNRKHGLNLKTRLGRGWQKIRAEVLARDSYRCVRCGSQPKRLTVHHKDPWRKSKNDSLDNLVTLCSRCHYEVEHVTPTQEYGGLSFHMPHMVAHP
jgi:5-methylcytosine-specific restriction endonuclease McrA